jgi:hypothetical protein
VFWTATSNNNIIIIIIVIRMDNQSLCETKRMDWTIVSSTEKNPCACNEFFCQTIDLSTKRLIDDGDCGGDGCDGDGSDDGDDGYNDDGDNNCDD